MCHCDGGKNDDDDDADDDNEDLILPRCRRSRPKFENMCAHCTSFSKPIEM